MEFIQKIKSVNVKPRKVRFVVRQIKHWPLLDTRERFNLLKTPTSSNLKKGLDAAIDRIKSVSEDPKQYIIKRINCDEGMKFKRRRIGSRGRSSGITKQRSNISIFISKKQESETEKTNK